MSITKNNITANFAGRVVTILTSLLVVPLYIKYLGIEAYGVIGFFVTVQTILNLLDFGIGATVNRQMATLSVNSGRDKELLDTKKTFEYLYWGISLVALLIIIAASGYISSHWLNRTELEHHTVHRAIIMMGVGFFFQFPWNLYNSALLGLQKQVTPNFIAAGMALVKAVGSVLVLKYVSASLSAFLLFQAACTFLQTLAAAFYLRYVLRTKDVKGQFSKIILVNNWRYTAGLFLTSILIVLLTQIDKVLLSRMVPLDIFGYYVLAGTVAANVQALILPVSTTYFPQFSQLTTTGNYDLLKQKFHQSSRLIALCVIPIGVVMFFLSKQVLFVWTGNEILSRNVYVLLSILICGMTFNTLMTIPYVLSLAVGWVRYGFHISIIALLFLIPFIFFATKTYGVTGGAAAWALLNLGYLVFAMQYFFSRQLSSEKLSWYWNTVLLPLFIAIPFGAAFYFFYTFISPNLSRWGQLVYLGIAYVVIAGNIGFIAYRSIFNAVFNLVQLKKINKAL